MSRRLAALWCLLAGHDWTYHRLRDWSGLRCCDRCGKGEAL